LSRSIIRFFSDQVHLRAWKKLSLRVNTVQINLFGVALMPAASR
jgi:hypothetical protein